MYSHTSNSGYYRNTKSVFLTIVACCLAIFTNGLWANIGQPGMWKAGGGISLLVPGDSLVSENIRMESERIDVMLYSGFAVVHGQYDLYHEGEEAIDFTMGYPINQLWQNAIYPEDQNPFGYSFQVDSLAYFEVHADGVRLNQESNDQLPNWITWNIHFEPGQRQIIEVVYLTPTDQSKVTNMQGVKKTNGFMYIFETGAMWKNQIDEAVLYVHLSDGLTEEDIEAIRPCASVESSMTEGILYFHQENWEPDPGENFYLLYQRRPNKYYTFQEAVQDRTHLFQKIRTVAQEAILEDHFKPMKCVDILKVETHSAYGRIVFGLLGGALMVFILIFFLIRKLLKKHSI